MKVKVKLKVKKKEKTRGRRRWVVGWVLVVAAVVLAGAVCLVWGYLGRTQYANGTWRWIVRSLDGRSVELRVVNLFPAETPEEARSRGHTADYVPPSRVDKPYWSGEWVRSDSRVWQWLVQRLDQESFDAKGFGVNFNVWSVPAVVGGVGIAVLLWSGRVMRRVRAGCCKGCGYDLAGLGVGAVCPECGKGEWTK